MDEQQSNKAHRAAGKADKAKAKVVHPKGNNPKAFAYKSGAKAQKLARQKVEQDQKKLHVPAIDRTFGGHGSGPAGTKSSTVGAAGVPSAKDDGPPPVIVAVMGPSGVGKTTLVRSLIRRYTKTTMTDIQGPVTVVTGKTRRLTVIECPNDLGAMVDLAKIADLVLVMIDGSFGLEMETFEALSAMSSHGLPKLIGILTHLDLIKSQSTLRQQKKRLKRRFWTEVYDGAKLFYLSGVINGRYPDREILNLSRFISVAKFRPLTFRNTHSYLLADRMEDLTPREEIRTNPKCDRTVALWGYLRGIPMRQPSQTSTLRIHIPGSGVDAFTVHKLAALADPCPLPTVESEKRRKLSDKNRLVHAPFSGGSAGLLGQGTGAVSFDGDRVWVNTAGNFTRKRAEDADENEVNEIVGEGERMVMDLQDVDYTLSDRMKTAQLRLFADDTQPFTQSIEGSSTGARRRRLAFGEDEVRQIDDDDDMSGSDSEDEDGSDVDDDERQPGRLLADESYDETGEALQYDEDEDSETQLDRDGVGVGFLQQDGDNDIADLEADNLLGEDELAEELEDEAVGPMWKRNLAAKALQTAEDAKLGQRPNLMTLIYASELSPQEVYAEQLRFRGGHTSAAHDNDNDSDRDEDTEDLFQLAARANASNDSDDEDRFRPRQQSREQPDWQDEDVIESFRHLFVSGQNFADGEAENGDKGFEDLEADGEPEAAAEAQPLSKEDELAAKKERLKRKFDAEYDGSDDEGDKTDFFTEQKDELRRRLEATQSEFAGDDAETRALVEGYRPGSYVRLEFAHVPCEMLDNFNAKFPLVVGALLPHEENFGFVQVRLKKHRWHPKILKTNDPLIFSIGWRRFQTVPIYSIDDSRVRNRMLKYTPEHMHCFATFYGPISSPNTGFCAFNSMTNEKITFRVSATGVVNDIDGSSKIVKKLKLTGVPHKIFKNTAYIRDMFNSALEVTKFEGAHIRTVSGIRGQIKKALPKPDGYFRAAFEDKVLMSDIIFLRAWYQIEPRKFYNPMANLLLEDKSSWRGMRLTGEVRRDEGVKTPKNVNSHYNKIERPDRKFNPLKVPRKLQASLPYASKPKIQKAQKNQTYMQKRAVVLDPEERKAIGLLQQIQAVQKVKVAKRQEKKAESRAARAKIIAKADATRQSHEKERKREQYRQFGKEEKRKEANANGGRYAKKQRTK